MFKHSFFFALKSFNFLELPLKSTPIYSTKLVLSNSLKLLVVFANSRFRSCPLVDFHVFTVYKPSPAPIDFTRDFD